MRAGGDLPRWTDLLGRLVAAEHIGAGIRRIGQNADARGGAWNGNLTGGARRIRMLSKLLWTKLAKSPGATSDRTVVGAGDSQRQIGRPRLISLPLVKAPPRAPTPPPIAAPTNGLAPAIAAMAAPPPAPINPPDSARSPRLYPHAAKLTNREIMTRRVATVRNTYYTSHFTSIHLAQVCLITHKSRQIR